MLTIHCPNPECGWEYHADEKHVGAAIKCRNDSCGWTVPIAAPLVRPVASGQESPVGSGPRNKKTTKADSTPILRFEALNDVPSALKWAAVLVLGAFALLLLVGERKNGLAPLPRTGAATTPTVPTDVREQPQHSPARQGQAPAAAAIGVKREPLEPMPPEPKPYDPHLEHFQGGNESSLTQPLGAPADVNGTTGQVAPMPSPRRLANGSLPCGSGVHFGHSVFSVENGTPNDALVRLFKDREEIRCFYVRHGLTVSEQELPPGTYIARVATGQDWNQAALGFNYDKAFEELDPISLEETTRTVTDSADASRLYDQIEYSRVSITLQKVLNGNLGSRVISEEEFWRGKPRTLPRE